MKTTLLHRALAAKRESWRIEFKETADFGCRQDVCELVKDVVAIANSGGGIIVFGLDNCGRPVGADLTSLRTLDPARVADNIHKYTGTHFADIEIQDTEKDGVPLVAWLISPSATPIAFVEPGTYAIDARKQRTAFSKGTVYYRHGAKSEPGSTEDIAAAFERRMEVLRKQWLNGVSQVVRAPPGARVSVAPPELQDPPAPQGTAVRITDDPRAPAFRMQDPDSTHPFRQKELIAEVRKRLPKGVTFNQYDVQAIRRVHGIDRDIRYARKPKFGSYQFSPACIDWIVNQATEDPEFLGRTRDRYRRP